MDGIRFTVLWTRRKVLTPGLRGVCERGAERVEASWQYVRGGKRETIGHARQRTGHDASLAHGSIPWLG